GDCGVFSSGYWIVTCGRNANCRKVTASPTKSSVRNSVLKKLAGVFISSPRAALVTSRRASSVRLHIGLQPWAHGPIWKCQNSPSTKIHTSVIGMKTFQPRRMIWSYRYRGNVARNQRKQNKKIQTLMNSHRKCGAASHASQLGSGQASNGEIHPPKKKIEVSAEIRIMLTYSATKNTANAMPEYSTWNPATISDSPSTTSNGARFVSAMPDTKYTTNSGGSHQKK